MRINEINGVNEGILDAARRGATQLRNKFSKPKNTQSSSPQVEPTMTPDAAPQFAAWSNARNPGAPAATSPQAAAPQPAIPTGGTAGQKPGGFLSGFAKGIGATDLSNTMASYAKTQSTQPTQAQPPSAPATQGNFPFPSSVPAAAATMPNTPPPVNEPEPEEEPTPTTSAGANAFGQMTKQLNVMPKTSTGGTLANTPTGVTHTASPNNPNQPSIRTKKFSKKQSKRMRETTDIAETLWRKMKRKR